MVIMRRSRVIFFYREFSSLDFSKQVPINIPGIGMLEDPELYFLDEIRILRKYQDHSDSLIFNSHAYNLIRFLRYNKSTSFLKKIKVRRDFFFIKNEWTTFSMEDPDQNSEIWIQFKDGSIVLCKYIGKECYQIRLDNGQMYTDLLQKKYSVDGLKWQKCF